MPMITEETPVWPCEQPHTKPSSLIWFFLKHVHNRERHEIWGLSVLELSFFVKKKNAQIWYCIQHRAFILHFFLSLFVIAGRIKSWMSWFCTHVIAMFSWLPKKPIFCIVDGTDASFLAPLAWAYVVAVCLSCQCTFVGTKAYLCYLLVWLI